MSFSDLFVTPAGPCRSWRRDAAALGFRASSAFQSCPISQRSMRPRSPSPRLSGHQRGPDQEELHLPRADRNRLDQEHRLRHLVQPPLVNTVTVQVKLQLEP